MLSKYTLADIDSIFSVHPVIADLPYSQRVSVYNQAQNKIAELFNDEVIQITNYSVTDNQIVPSGTAERNTIPEVSEDDKYTMKLGTYTLGQLTYIIDELEDFSVTERQMILNIAQDILTRLKNDYDALGYYQLWYNSTANKFEKEYEFRFKTAFSATITNLTDYITTIKNTYGDELGMIDVSGSQKIDNVMSFKTNFTTSISYVQEYLAYETRFKTSFETSIVDIYQITAEDEARFKTSFVATIYTPLTLTEENESRFRTSFTTTI